MSSSLYSQDFNLWCEETARNIRSANYTQEDTTSISPFLIVKNAEVVVLMLIPYSRVIG